MIKDDKQHNTRIPIQRTPMNLFCVCPQKQFQKTFGKNLQNFKIGLDKSTEKIDLIVNYLLVLSKTED
jgi:hypothetical protein